MTKKDYVLIADAVNEHRKGVSRFGPNYLIARGVAQTIAEALATDNPRFKRDVFLKACGFDVEQLP